MDAGDDWADAGPGTISNAPASDTIPISGRRGIEGVSVTAYMQNGPAACGRRAEARRRRKKPARCSAFVRYFLIGSIGVPKPARGPLLSRSSTRSVFAMLNPA